MTNRSLYFSLFQRELLSNHQLDVVAGSCMNDPHESPLLGFGLTTLSFLCHQYWSNYARRSSRLESHTIKSNGERLSITNDTFGFADNELEIVRNKTLLCNDGVPRASEKAVNERSMNIMHRELVHGGRSPNSASRRRYITGYDLYRAKQEILKAYVLLSLDTQHPESFDDSDTYRHHGDTMLSLRVGQNRNSSRCSIPRTIRSNGEQDSVYRDDCEEVSLVLDESRSTSNIESKQVTTDNALPGPILIQNDLTSDIRGQSNETHQESNIGEMIPDPYRGSDIEDDHPWLRRRASWSSMIDEGRTIGTQTEEEDLSLSSTPFSRSFSLDDIYHPNLDRGSNRSCDTLLQEENYRLREEVCRLQSALSDKQVIVDQQTILLSKLCQIAGIPFSPPTGIFVDEEVRNVAQNVSLTSSNNTTGKDFDDSNVENADKSLCDVDCGIQHHETMSVHRKLENDGKDEPSGDVTLLSEYSTKELTDVELSPQYIYEKKQEVSSPLRTDMECPSFRTTVSPLAHLSSRRRDSVKNFPVTQNQDHDHGRHSADTFNIQKNHQCEQTERNLFERFGLRQINSSVSETVSPIRSRDNHRKPSVTHSTGLYKYEVPKYSPNTAPPMVGFNNHTKDISPKIRRGHSHI